MCTQGTDNQAACSTFQLGWRQHLLALLCYTILGLIATFPLALHLDSHIIGNEFGAVDGYLGIWNVWWTAQALQRGQSPFFTPLLFYPDGLDLFWQTLSLPQGLLAAPITILAGPLVAYNVLIIISFVLGGYCAFLFIHYRTGAPLAALIGGAVYSLAPFHLQKVIDAQLEVASIQWVPCYLLSFHLLLARPSWRRALVAGLLLLWVGLGTWYYGLFCILYTGIAALLWTSSAGGLRHWITHMAWGVSPVLIWLVIIAPRLYSLAQTGDHMLGEARNFNAASSADLIAFWLPSPLHPIWGSQISNFYLGLHPRAMLWNVSFGLVAITLALIGALVTWRSTWRWLVLLVATMMLAMGEQLQAFGVQTGIPLPYMALAGLPGIRSSHRPNHIVIISLVIVALMAAYGMQHLFRRWPRQRRSLAAGALLAILAIDGWGGPLPLVSRPIPDYYATIPPTDGGALLPIPINLNISRSENLWYQTVHHWPIIGGFIGREPPYPLGQYAPGIRELRYGSRESSDILTPGWPALAREALAAYRIRYVIFHPDAMGPTLSPMRELIAELGIAATHSTSQIEVYPVPTPERRRVLAFLGPGWGRLEQQDEQRWRWMSDAAEIYLLNPHDQPREVDLVLDAESYQHSRPVTIRLDSGSLGTLTISRARMRVHLKLLLTPGEHVVYLEAPADPRPGRSHQLISIAFLGIQASDNGP